MSKIVPCITVESSDEFKSSLERLTPFAERVHIDVSDGEFTPNFLLEPEKISWPGNWTVDIHAMVARPSEHIQKLIALKPNLLTFHAEIQEDIVKVLKFVKQSGIKAGVSLLKTTVPNSVRAAIEEADHVLIFSGDLGHYGGTASLMQLEKVRLIRSIRPSVEIGWDGGANIENVFSLTQGGVDVINVGGAIAKADNPQSVYDNLVREINKRSVI